MVFVSDVPLVPGDHGNRVRARAMVQALRQAGYRIGYVLWERSPSDPASLEEMGRMVDALSIIPSSRLPEPQPSRAARLLGVVLPSWAYRLVEAGYSRTRRFAQRLRTQNHTDQDRKDSYPDESVQDALDVMLRSRPAAAVIAHYVYMAPVLSAARAHGLLGVIDTIDVFHRHEPLHKAGRLAAGWFVLSREAEARLLDLADVVVAIQPREAELLAGMVSPKKVVCVEHVPLDAAGADEDGPASPGSLVIVGSDNPFNVEGLEWFLNRVWPAVLKAHPEAALHVYGNLAGARRWSAPRVHLHGFVADAAVAYRGGLVVINPVQWGTGLKIKTVDALAHGKALVTTTLGAEGLEDAAGEAFLVAADAAAFASLLGGLLADPEQARRIGERARAYAQKRFSPEHVYAPLLERLAGARPGWSYQVAQASEGASIRRPVPPSPPLKGPLGEAWQQLAGAGRTAVANLVRGWAEQADAALELWCVEREPGGSEQTAVLLADALRRLGFRCRARVPEPSGVIRRAFEGAGCEILPLHPERPLPERGTRMVHLFADESGASFAALAALAAGRTPWVVTPHSACATARRGDREATADLRLQWARAARVCFGSEYGRKVAGFTIGLQGVAHAAVWQGATPAPESPREGGGVEFVWLWEGPPTPSAQHDSVLRAVRRALDLGGKPIRVLMAGARVLAPAFGERLRALELGDVVPPTDWPDDPSELYRRTDAVLVTGDEWDLPPGLVGAMMAGLPVVATAAGGVSEVMRHGQEGLLCASGDADALAAAVRRVTDEPATARRLAECARAVARDALTLEEMALRYALIYLDVLGTGGGGAPTLLR